MDTDWDGMTANPWPVLAVVAVVIAWLPRHEDG
jgi:hypothetical protein